MLAQSKDEQAVAVAVETLRQAMLDADKTSLENITAEQLSYGHSSGLIEDKEAFVQALVSGDADFKTIALDNQRIQIVGNTALVRHQLIGSIVSKGNPSDLRLGVLLVWQKQGKAWKLLARQAYKL
ncbi:MAG: nuclear transport factor 2 family protein [Bacteroidia bacterium]|nr:nuclear transport factor 2 family protein [Bacteroidia bacterium]